MTKERITLRSRKAEATRKKIFETAMSLFEQNGYQEVTVDEICEKASVSKGTFYHYFASKDQVVMEFFMQNDSYYLKAYQEISHMESRIDQLAAYGRAVVSHVVNNMGLHMTKPIYHSQIAPGSGVSPMTSKSRPLYLILEKIVREGQERGEIRRDISCEDITQLITVLFRGLIYEWCLYDGELDVDHVMENIFFVFLDSFRQKD